MGLVIEDGDLPRPSEQNAPMHEYHSGTNEIFSLRRDIQDLKNENRYLNQVIKQLKAELDNRTH